jgi:hypothetical protein
MNFCKTDGDRICKTFKDDCVIRSISIATRKPYNYTFWELMHLGIEVGAYPNHDKVWVRYLEGLGFIKHKPPRDSQGKLIKLADWDFEGVAVVKSSGHLTAVDGGTVRDSWDCRYRPVNSYWAKPGS